MKDILCKILGFLKYILLIAAFGLVFYGIIVTYGRLEKPLVESIPVFIPFGVVFLLFIITLIMRAKTVSKNLLFNFVSVFVFVVTIIICLRAMFDTNMILFHKYSINYNPAFFSDNLSAIEAMIYMLGVANLILLVCDLLNKDNKSRKNNSKSTVSYNDNKTYAKQEKKEKNNDKDFFEKKKDILEDNNIDKDTEEVLETKDKD